MDLEETTIKKNITAVLLMVVITQNVQTIWFNHIVPIVILVIVVMLDIIIPVTNQTIIPIIIQIIINQENLEK